jgi:hypothetical protein
MSEFQLEDSVVWREFKRLEREAGPDGLIDLAQLWRVAGRPKRLSPRRRYPKDCPGVGDDIKILKSNGKKADSPAWATANTAHDYVQRPEDHARHGRYFLGQGGSRPGRDAHGCPG